MGPCPGCPSLLVPGLLTKAPVTVLPSPTKLLSFSWPLAPGLAWRGRSTAVCMLVQPRFFEYGKSEASGDFLVEEMFSE